MDIKNLEKNPLFDSLNISANFIGQTIDFSNSVFLNKKIANLVFKKGILYEEKNNLIFKYGSRILSRKICHCKGNIWEKYKEPTADALVESALYHAKILEDNDFQKFKISVKASNALLSIAAYSSLSEKIDCPLHVGITEAGSFRAGTVKSSIGIGNLLLNGIGDTIRVSLSSDPCDEVRVGFDILKSLGLRQKGVTVISCPSCARQQFDVISTVREIEEQLDDILTPITVSIIGCVVNGPGEARSTDVGITGGGKGTHQIYVNGIPDHVIKNQSVVDHVVNEVRKKLSSLN